MHVGVYVSRYGCLQRSEEVIRFPGAGVKVVISSPCGPYEENQVLQSIATTWVVGGKSRFSSAATTWALGGKSRFSRAQQFFFIL